jgi:glutamate-ammonia-ligase adenylyltransferase
MGKVSQTEATVLQSAYTLCWQLRAALRLVSDKAGADLGQGAISFVLREVGAANAAVLEAQLAAVTQAADAVISARLGQ